MPWDSHPLPEDTFSAFRGSIQGGWTGSQKRAWQGRGKPRFYSWIAQLCGVMILTEAYLKQSLTNND